MVLEMTTGRSSIIGRFLGKPNYHCITYSLGDNLPENFNELRRQGNSEGRFYRTLQSVQRYLTRLVGGARERIRPSYYCISCDVDRSHIGVEGEINMNSSNHDSLVNYLSKLILENPLSEINVKGLDNPDTSTVAFLVEVMKKSGCHNLNISMGSDLVARCNMSKLNACDSSLSV